LLNLTLPEFTFSLSIRGDEGRLEGSMAHALTGLGQSLSYLALVLLRDYPWVGSSLFLLIFDLSLQLGFAAEIEVDFRVSYLAFFQSELQFAISRVMMSWCPNSHVTPVE
jgi:hypothetical protein